MIGGKFTAGLGLSLLGVTLSGCGGAARGSGGNAGDGTGGTAAADPFAVAGSSTGSVPPLDGPFVVTDHFLPRAPFGDGAVEGHVKQSEACPARISGARGKCYRFDYVPGEVAYTGMYFMPAPGEPDPVPVVLSNLHKISFQAAGTTSPQYAMFYAGGIRHGEGNRTPELEDQFQLSTSVTLSADWQHFELALVTDPNVPVTQLVGAFGWSMYPPEGVSPPPTMTLFLDDIVYE
jgi:hypothetical protein